MLKFLSGMFQNWRYQCLLKLISKLVTCGLNHEGAMNSRIKFPGQKSILNVSLQQRVTTQTIAELYKAVPC